LLLGFSEPVPVKWLRKFVVLRFGVAKKVAFLEAFSSWRGLGPQG
jgi:hypothetical protein